ncbi:dTDP-4-dehydrorhamnose 3,5-epimerase [Gammaproteobacteria bacterium]|nr:dTDP-4-dehydrorhamnose 3,5-epimerase [Gammaproteobacteria bacterium]
MEGVLLTPLRIIPTGKGDVKHALKRTDIGFEGFGEVYFTEIFEGDVKGWKKHTRMTLNLVVVSGKVEFTIKDERKGSVTYGQEETIILSDTDEYARLTIAPDLWMCFKGLVKGKSLVMDVITEEHDPLEAEIRPL